MTDKLTREEFEEMQAWCNVHDGPEHLCCYEIFLGPMMRRLVATLAPLYDGQHKLKELQVKHDRLRIACEMAMETELIHIAHDILKTALARKL